MTVTPFECPAEWTNDCGCLESHNYCWPEPSANCCPQLQVTEETLPNDVIIIEQSKRIAVQILHHFSGQQFGLCRRVVRPCRDDCRDSQSVPTAWVNGQLQPTLIGGFWYNDPCMKCPSACSCTEVCEVTLPGPIESIVEIRIDGQLLDPADYRVDNRRKLVAQGSFCWPKCQDMTAPAGGPNTWTVEYLRGTPVPEAGRWAAGLLACELVKSCSPDATDCALPDNVKTVTREGLTLEMAPFIIGGADGEIAFGRTGVPEVDMWLTAVNPHKVRSRSRVYSPDRPTPRRTTWPCP